MRQHFVSIKVPTICLVDGCPARETKAGRCAAHQRKPWAQRSPSSQALASNPDHRRERIRAARRAKGRCEHCGRPPAEGKPLQLHHPHPIGQGGAVVQPDARLLCPPCHRRADQKAGARR